MVSNSSAFASPTVDIVILVVVVVAAIVGYISKKKRASAIKAWANEKGWTVKEGGNVTGYLHLFNTAPFNGPQPRFEFSVVGKTEKGREAFILDYTTTTGYGHNRRTTPYHIIGLETNVDIERIVVHKKTLIDFEHSINFESLDFNKKFNVEADSDKEAYAVITPEVIVQLLETLPNRIFWEKSYIVWVENGNWTPEEIDENLDSMLINLEAIADLMPNYIASEHTVQSIPAEFIAYPIEGKEERLIREANKIAYPDGEPQKE
jgi:hypothetical protein